MRYVALAVLATACSLAVATASRSADGLSGLYVVVDGPQAGVIVEADQTGEVDSNALAAFQSRGFIRRPERGCRSLHFEGRIEGDRSGSSCWKVVPYRRASRLLDELNLALTGEEAARNVNNQKALEQLRFARRHLERAFDAVESAARAGEIGEGKFERLKDDFIDVRRIDDAAEGDLRNDRRQLARRRLERALDLKHAIVDALPRHLLLAQPPDLRPMLADFVPAQSQTVYTQRATNPDGRDLRYRWTLVEHNDFTCVNFEPNEPRENQAIWHHGDDQGCDHNLEGQNGHVGTITVVVRDGRFECVAFYNGSNDGAGPDPPRCRPLD